MFPAPVSVFKQTTMNFRFLLLAISLLLCGSAGANTGCSTYNGLYPNGLNSTNALTGNVNYDNTNYIAYRYYDQDPNCGIRSNRVATYSPLTNCDVRGVRTYGILVTYNPADNSCMPLPMDDLVLPAMAISGSLAFLAIKNATR